MDQRTTIYDIPLEIVDHIATINKDPTIFSSLSCAYKPFGLYTLHHQVKYLPYFLNQKQKDTWLIIWIKENNFIKVKFLLEITSKLDYDMAMANAAACGNKEIVQLMLKNGTKSYYNTMANAAYYGHIDIVRLMLEKVVDDRIKRNQLFMRRLNTVMAYAALRGHMEIVELMLQKGAWEYDKAMSRAAEGGHMEIVNLMLEKGAKGYNWAMAMAAKGGHMDIIKLMLGKRVWDYNSAMIHAAKSGHMDIVKLMLEKGAWDYKKAMEAAAKSGHIEIVQLIQKKEVDDYYKIVSYSILLIFHLPIIIILLVNDLI